MSGHRRWSQITHKAGFDSPARRKARLELERQYQRSWWRLYRFLKRTDPAT
jgi:hypothetical protein